jgi:hypothetical protein
VKRAISTLLILALFLSVSACTSGASVSGQSVTTSEQTEEAKPEKEEAPAEEPAEPAPEEEAPPADEDEPLPAGQPEEPAPEEPADQAEPEEPPADEPADAEPEAAEPGEIEIEPADDGAQGDVNLEESEGPEGTNLVCNDSGCFYTPLSIDDLELVDPDKEFWQLPEDVDPDSYDRIICVVGDTCYYAKITVEDLQLLLPEANIFTSHSDADLVGYWNIVNDKAEVTCTDLGAIPLPEVTDTGIIAKIGNDLVGTGLAEDAPSLTLDRLGDGTYMSYLSVDTPEGPVVFTYFLALQDDNSFFGFFNSDFSNAAAECHVTRTFTGTRS